MNPQALYPSILAPRRVVSGVALAGSIVMAKPADRTGNGPH